MSQLNGYLDKIIEELKDKSPKEILSYAIFNEAEEVRYYDELASKAKKESVKLLFLRMSETSQKHREWLYGLFKKLYPGEEPVKISTPLVEIAPFHTEFEKVEDYLEAVRHWMQSELSGKRLYETLAEKAENEESRAVFAQLAVMEEEQYEELKKVYDLMVSMREKSVETGRLRPGGYLFTDRFKARCFLADLLEEPGSEAVIFTRDSPENVMRFFGRKNIRVVWISSTKAENSVSPEEFFRVKNQVRSFFESRKLEGGRGVVLIEDVGYLLVELGFKKLMDILACIRDYALLNGTYFLITATGELFERREWALLTSEFKLVS